MKAKVTNLKMRAWIKDSDLNKIRMFTKKPKEKCVEIEVSLIPLKREIK